MLLTDALAIEVGLDPKALRKGLAEVSTSMRKAREGAQKDGTAIERSLDGAAEAVDRLARNALKLFALFTAGRAVKDFVQDITSADAALGRLAKSIGSTPEAISSLANAVARGGGSVAATAGSFEKLSDSINEIKVTGNSSLLPMLGRLQGISGKAIRLNQDLATTFGDIADAAKGTADKMGAPFATYLLKQAGIDRDTAALLIQGRDKLNEALERSRKVGIVSDKDTKAAQALTTSIETLRQTSESFGRQILTGVSPTITRLLTQFQEWIEKNRGIIDSKIAEYIKRFSDWINSINWEAVGEGLRNFGAGALRVADSFGGLLKICEALFLFWVGSKAIRMVQAILGVAGLLGSGPLGWAIRLAMGAAALGAVTADQMPKVLAKEGAAGVDPATGGATERPPADLYGKEGAARPWLRRQWNRVKRVFGGGSAEAHNGGSPMPEGSGAGNLTRLTEEEAKRAGIDPRIMHGIRAGESGHGAGYDRAITAREQSYGPWQLNRKGGLGTEFERETGMDLTDPKTIPAQTRWVAQYIARQRKLNPNWSPGGLWHGYRGNQDADPKWGDSGYKPTPDATAQGGNKPAAGTPEGVTDISGQAAYRGGQLSDVKGFVFHHTGGRGTPEGVVNTLNQRGLGVQYVMDRDGKIYQTLAPGARGSHIKPAQNGSGLTNSNSLGMEVIAKDDKDINPIQVEAAKRFMAQMQKQYPGIQVYGHGELNSHKQETEGRTIVDAIRRSQPPAATAAAEGRTGSAPTPGSTSALEAQRAGAMAAIVQAQAAQAAVTGNTSNDNRATTDNSSQWNIQNVNLHTAATDGRAAAGEFVDTIRGRSYAAAANRGLA
ncbi:peptidoglycan recognition protein family protein [Methylobacterium sp. J-048]|uniref:peptidoglycan recognition protein family protein n=1 Tax=Methylobacterium sp. J-048 TaxID=2836635 RepID=UPI001FBB254D|nr:peptidoglycan recognition family protein [Methylobacterium sp. J-048]MCJ2056853.1 peptidoglycan recognition protein family protein [Methylobacterium sp. J-048]